MIVQHCFGAPHAGGPATALSRMQALRSQPWPEIWQHDAAGGVSMALLSRFIREIKHSRAQLLHVRGLGNEGFHATLAGKLAGVPKILVSIHGTHRDLQGGSGRLRRCIVVNFLERATLEMADALVTVSVSASQRGFLAPYSDKLLPPVPNGVPLPIGIDDARAAARALFGFKPDTIVAACVSRLTEQKGYGDLADALRILDTEPSGLQLALLVVGDGEGRERIERQFEGLNKCAVHFVGHQADVSPFLSASDIFVFPSWHENLSNALLEAMSYRLPVVATSVGGNIEVINRGGGLLIPPHSPGDLATAISRLACDDNLRNKMSAEARTTIEAHYSVEQMLQSWENRYSTILAENNKSCAA